MFTGHYYHKNSKLKKNKKTCFVGFFRWVFLGGFFGVGFYGWVFYCQPCLDEALALLVHLLHVAPLLGGVQGGLRVVPLDFSLLQLTGLHGRRLPVEHVHRLDAVLNHSRAKKIKIKKKIYKHRDALIKKKIKFSSYIRKFRGIGCKVIND
jgi:hypothetical protein